MAYFLKTVSATFAAGLICGAGALVALAPGPANEVPQANKAGASTQPDKAQVAVVSPTSVPCKDQVWPAIDRRCMRWTAEGWTGKAGEPPGKAAEPAAPAKPTVPAAAQPKPQTPPLAEPRTAAAKPAAPVEAPKQTAPQQAATPAAPQPAQAEAQPAEPPATTAQPTASIAADESGATKSVHHAEKAKKPHRTRVARSREHEREAQYRDNRDYYRDSRRVARAWGDDGSSEVVTRRYIVRPASPFFLFGGN